VSDATCTTKGYNEVMFDNTKEKIPCFKCHKGTMQKLLEYSGKHVLMQCTNCGKIDEIAILDDHGKTIMTSVVQEWDEPVEKAFDELMANVSISLASLEQWKKAHPDKINRLHAAISGWNEFENLYYLMVNVDKSKGVVIKGVPWQYVLLEADRELKASVSLAIQGHTKVAYKSLRSYLELSLFGLSLMGGSEDDFTAWFNGGKTPSFNGDGGILKSIVNKEKYKLPELSAWEDEVKDLYKTLSGYVHTQGKEFSSLWLWNSAHLRFDESTWEKWTELAIATIQLVGLALIGAAPTALLPFDVLRVEAFDAPTGLFVDFKQSQIIADMFSPENLQRARAIVAQDEQANSFIETVSKSRVLSDEEIDKSMKHFLDGLEKSGRYADELKTLKSTPGFQATVRWTMLYSLQKKVERDIGLEAIANTLSLVH
jgi:hypothetical protein